MATVQISVKNVEESIFNEFKAEAVREKTPVGKALNLAMGMWLWKNKKPKMSILNYKPISWGKSTERTSEEVDEIIYGK